MKQPAGFSLCLPHRFGGLFFFSVLLFAFLPLQLVQDGGVARMFYY